eukprot:8077-Heterococcus_DN1.PRE.3
MMNRCAQNQLELAASLSSVVVSCRSVCMKSRATLLIKVCFTLPSSQSLKLTGQFACQPQFVQYGAAAATAAASFSFDIRMVIRQLRYH